MVNSLKELYTQFDIKNAAICTKKVETKDYFYLNRR